MSEEEMVKCRDTGVVQHGVSVLQYSRTSEKDGVSWGTAKWKEILCALK